jgi:hypothetical protein
VPNARKGSILMAMEDIFRLGLSGFVIVGVVLGLMAVVELVKAPYRK